MSSTSVRTSSASWSTSRACGAGTSLPWAPTAGGTRGQVAQRDAGSARGPKASAFGLSEGPSPTSARSPPAWTGPIGGSASRLESNQALELTTDGEHLSLARLEAEPEPPSLGTLRATVAGMLPRVTCPSCGSPAGPGIWTSSRTCPRRRQHGRLAARWPRPWSPRPPTWGCARC